MKLLHIDSSILGDNSVSRAISAAVVERLRGTIEGLTIVTRDLAASPLAHLSGAHLAGHAPDAHNDLDAFLAADIVVIGSPMYNFTVPTQLKAWIDRILIAGKTFRYTEAGPQGLAGGKRVILALSRGGFYGEGAPHAMADHQESYLKLVFGFIGIPNVEIIRAEGIAMGPEQRSQALEAALGQAGRL